MNFYQAIRMSLTGEDDLYALLERAILKDQLEEAELVSSFVNLSRFKLGDGNHQPVFFSLLHNRTEIADMMILKGGSVDDRYPEGSIHQGKCAIEVAVSLAAKGRFVEQNLPILNSYSKGGCHYEEISVMPSKPELTFSQQVCKFRDAIIDCAGVPKQCYSFDRPDICINYSVIAQKAELSIYRFKDYNNGSHLFSKEYEVLDNIGVEQKGVNIFEILYGVESDGRTSWRSNDDETNRGEGESNFLRGENPTSSENY